MQCLPVSWVFALHLDDNLSNSIRKEEEILVKFMKVMYLTAMLQRDDFRNHRRGAVTRYDDIDNSGNGGKIIGNGGVNHCGTEASVSSCNKEARGLAGGREWDNHIAVRRAFVYKVQGKNAAKP